jgi:hypothetical protein
MLDSAESSQEPVRDAGTPAARIDVGETVAHLIWCVSVGLGRGRGRDGWDTMLMVDFFSFCETLTVDLTDVRVVATTPDRKSPLILELGLKVDFFKMVSQ